MDLTEERLAVLLAYCKLTEFSDDPEVETVIPMLYDAAVGYMEGAGIRAFATGTKQAAQYDLLVNAMVLDAWDRRDMIITGTIVANNPAFRRMLGHLKHVSAAVSDSDTAGEA